MKIYYTWVFILLVLAEMANAQNQSLLDTNVVLNEKKCRIRAKEIEGNKVMLTLTVNTKVTWKETIYKNGFLGIELTDFNKDGNSDIILSYTGNNPVCFLYLFYSKNGLFKNVEGFENFPEAIQLKTNPKYYYSYHRAGCADLNWVSDLFRIENFKTIHVGHIYGQGCDFEIKENPQVIEIYRIINNDAERRKLIEKRSYLKFIPEFGDKWDFIKKYWNNHYSKFE
jgi:hypothetical protein